MQELHPWNFALMLLVNFNQMFKDYQNESLDLPGYPGFSHFISQPTQEYLIRRANPGNAQLVIV
jgi:hypothetical protein